MPPRRRHLPYVAAARVTAALVGGRRSMAGERVGAGAAPVEGGQGAGGRPDGPRGRALCVVPAGPAAPRVHEAPPKGQALIRLRLPHAPVDVPLECGDAGCGCKQPEAAAHHVWPVLIVLKLFFALA